VQDAFLPIAGHVHVQDLVDLATSPRTHLELCSDLLIKLFPLSFVGWSRCHDDVVKQGGHNHLVRDQLLESELDQECRQSSM